MGNILLVIFVWVTAFVCWRVMKRIQPENKLYPWYVLTICIIFTVFVAMHVS